MRWTTNKEQNDYMRKRQEQNLALSLNNAAENWAAKRLKKTKLGWKRQSLWGCRIFDFWCGAKGIAVEIDGPEHDPEYDSVRDEYNFLRSGILVYRVPNFDEAAMAKAIEEIIALPFFRERKRQLGLLGYPGCRQSLIRAAGIPKAHGKWTPPEI